MRLRLIGLESAFRNPGCTSAPFQSRYL
uniref:Uncharacterized protein n=1 Tax=Anguilla anguilla TaxID=7936 RepID=A0A0E9URY1_ANGAN